ncbi:unnamed protein product [Arctogadus glacialis]
MEGDRPTESRRIRPSPPAGQTKSRTARLRGQRQKTGRRCREDEHESSPAREDDEGAPAGEPKGDREIQSKREEPHPQPPLREGGEEREPPREGISGDGGERREGRDEQTDERATEETVERVLLLSGGAGRREETT